MADGNPRTERLHSDVGRLVRELRRAKDASGLSLSALAEATPYSRSSWERFLNGTQFPPRAAVEALAVRSGGGGGGGEDGERLLALWEVAECAWSGRARTAAVRETSRPEPPEETPAGAAAGVTVAATAGAGEPSGTGAPAAADDPGSDASDGVRDRPRRPRRRVLAVSAAAAVALAVVCTVAVLRASPADDPGRGSPSGTPSAQEPPVTGVEAQCFGTACDGKDAVEMGCGGDAWTAAVSRVQGRFVEVRYSSTCRTAWARVKSAVPGDRVEVVRKDGRTFDEVVPDDANLAAFTFMLSAPSPRQVKTCWELSTGEKGCTRHGSDKPLPGASPVPS
ncbi:DUF2690 domain-containing protein [Streptomyces sp. NPDC059452]|uniref:helix-turn-helix domain-containing protein n=1 Tax=Streptomyces sp. NPDC059452 TaxID=3346835 RepID=UPI0036CA073B